MPPRELGQQAREEVVAGADHGDRKRAAGDALQAGHRFLGLVELPEDGATLRDQLLACGRQVDASAQPLEERQPGVALELADLRGDRRLREVQLLRGAGEAQVLRDRLEDLELPEGRVFHNVKVMVTTTIYDYTL